jgi:23S rRNA (adenine2503-C2)-methyltransferase
MELLGKSRQELREWMAALGDPAYRGAQLYHALYAERRFDLAQITSLPAALRVRLAGKASVTLPRVVRRYASSDGTIRYVLELPEEGRAARVEHLAGPLAVQQPWRAATVETVFMPEESRQTICISTQAGCAVDCHFCLTATLGLIRNLTAGEIIGQVLLALEENRAALRPQTNVVLMGQGEPLLNCEPVFAALRILLDPNGVGLSPRHVTLSTSGILPGIERMAREPVRPKLAVSLNASHDEQRDQIMPINRKYPIADLLAACRAYPLRPWERLTFEYVLLGGFNDAPDDARRLARLVAGLRCKINLIPWNPGQLPYRPPLPSAVQQFRQILDDKQILNFVRRSRGQEINAACGQLALLETVP